MKTEHLNALLIDQSLGELPEEVSHLLEAYLEQNPEHRAVASRTREALGLTEKVVIASPELFCAAGEETASEAGLPAILSFVRPSAWLKVAAALIALGLAAGAGFIGGSRQTSEKGTSLEMATENGAPSGDKATSSPWARYRLGENGQLAVVPAYEPQS
ncbi:MAG: hypothetical protein KDN19_04425 [Verrucomicrobiae bacterium]|nr:hypothetical protein [Verrucomicrobiae bacterium]